jgi:dGTPase
MSPTGSDKERLAGRDQPLALRVRARRRHAGIGSSVIGPKAGHLGMRGLVHDRSVQTGGPLLRRDRAVREVEEESLSQIATRSTQSRGRLRPEDPDEFRTAFERDRDRIVHSKAFRRLKHKTQVFLHPEGDHFVTRLTHTLQVAQIARSLAAALALNEPLAEAIALGHDVGHTPFGHAGEDALSPYFPPEGWQHAAQSVRIFEVLEDLNLTWEVRDGIRAHTWKIVPPPRTPEATCVRFADRIAYLAHDALDALRAGVLAADAFPAHALERFGQPGRDWISTMIDAVISQSLRHGSVQMDEQTLAVMHELRDFMFQRVYQSAEQVRQQQQAIAVLRDLMDWHLDHPDEIPATYRQPEAALGVQVADYVAGMTDRYALATHQRLFGPRPEPTRDSSLLPD